MQEVVERVFRDEDGIIRSAVYGKTMKPLQLEEVTDRPWGIGSFSENHSIPNELKPIYNNYENVGQASGKYIRAMLRKYRVTGRPECLERARLTFKALVLLWNNVAEWVPEWCGRADINPYGRGWMPKPFGGIRQVAGMTECSPDQYTDMTLGLECFYHQVADEQEKNVIEQMILSFADWWYRHDYTTNYEGGCSWWKMRPDCIHVISFFLYLNALANSWCSEERYQKGYQLWLGLFEQGLNARSLWGGPNAAGLTIQCLERLIELQPENSDAWKRGITAATEHLVGRVKDRQKSIPGIKGLFEFRHFGAWYLCDAYRIGRDESHRKMIEEFLGGCYQRVHFYHVKRGVPIDELSPVIAGGDYRNVFMAEGHVCWLGAYWGLKEIMGR